MEAADFINKILQRKPANRLGFNGPTEVKNHMWFNNLDWQKIINKQMQAPYSPSQEAKIIEDNTKISLNQVEENLLLLRRNSIQNLFNGYEYDIEQLHHAALQEKRKRKLQAHI